MGSFWAKHILSELKKCRGVIFHDTEEWYKIREEELTCCVFQNWHEEFDKFWPEHLKVSKKFPFNRLFLSKVYIVWAKRVQRSYLSWYWRVIQNLETNRLVLKLTWGIWQIFTRALESVRIGTWWEPFVQSRKFMSLKVTEESCVMTMKNDMTWGIWWILTRALKNLKNLLFNWLLRPIYIIYFKLKRSYVWWHWRFWRKTDLCFQKWHEEFGKFA